MLLIITIMNTSITNNDDNRAAEVRRAGQPAPLHLQQLPEDPDV